MRKPMLILITIISLTGCATMRPVSLGAAKISRQHDADDHLVVYEKSGRVIEMTYVEMIDGTLRGRLTDSSQEPISVILADIERLDVEKMDGVKTTLAVVGGTIVMLPLAVVVAMTGAVLSGIVLALSAALGAGMVLAGQ